MLNHKEGNFITTYTVNPALLPVTQLPKLMFHLASSPTRSVSIETDYSGTVTANFPNAFQKCWTTTTPILSLTLAAVSYQEKYLPPLCIGGDGSL